MLTLDTQGLIPAIVQDALSGRILMLGWMNEEALRRTLSSGEVWFWSRSRQTLWHKGETSGNVLRVRELRADCDADCLLIRAEPAGPTCHTGRESCFWQDIEGNALLPPAGSFLDELAEVIASRRLASPRKAIPPACSTPANCGSRKRWARRAWSWRWPALPRTMSG